MFNRSMVLAEVDKFLVETGMSATAFGIMAVNDGHFVRRLRAGKDVNLSTVERACDAMAAERRRAAAPADAVA